MAESLSDVTENAAKYRASLQVRSNSWQLPETLSGHSGVRLKSAINGQAEMLADDELTRINYGAQETARRMLETENSLAEAWGYRFSRSEENPSEFIFTHKGADLQTMVEGRIRWESGDYLNAEFVLFDANVLDTNEAE